MVSTETVGSTCWDGDNGCSLRTSLLSYRKGLLSCFRQTYLLPAFVSSLSVTVLLLQTWWRSRFVSFFLVCYDQAVNKLNFLLPSSISWFFSEYRKMKVVCCSPGWPATCWAMWWASIFLRLRQCVCVCVCYCMHTYVPVYFRVERSTPGVFSAYFLETGSFMKLKSQQSSCLHFSKPWGYRHVWPCLASYVCAGNLKWGFHVWRISTLTHWAINWVQFR